MEEDWREEGGAGEAQLHQIQSVVRPRVVKQLSSPILGLPQLTGGRGQNPPFPQQQLVVAK